MVIEGGSWSSRPVTCQSERVLPWGGQSHVWTDRLMTTDSTSRLAGIRSLFDPVDAMRPYRYIECTVIIDHSYQYWAQDTKKFFPNLPGRVRNSHEINERNIPSFCTKSAPPPSSESPRKAGRDKHKRRNSESGTDNRARSQSPDRVANLHRHPPTTSHEPGAATAISIRHDSCHVDGVRVSPD